MTQTTATAIRFFVAAPRGNQAAIAGLGHTAEAAIFDAHAQTGTQPAVVSQAGDGTWTVADGLTEPREFSAEADADEHAASLGMVATECTERFYVHMKMHGIDGRWGSKGDLLDLDLEDDEAALDDAVDEVRAGFEGLDDGAKDEWTPETALADAHDYVFAYVIEGDETGMWGDLAEVGTPFRTALDLLVRDEIIDHIEAR
ncbi:hypothetical protein NS228_05330 [Methylobacterium indicum]|uniref:hypothetical protein n=1 Tax=Methylobacterium indicum TaxID=1775910 RepID=UPI00073475B5|nr:hypothetical protein [Methylobacterium indicum]KTS34213.1 hypothetical protein NS229_11395 [Methylobacterium indicum]KTS41803.1 hypothetical protein NS228_05330 [Methylobacterium indicum]KTS53101.1 hypothetical protein NS230_07645 [Methylobacterium indicum]